MSPRKDRKPADPRHAALKAFLERYWRQETGLGDIPWGAADAGALGQFLRANPNLELYVIEACLGNRLRSEDHAPGERFYRWIGDLLRYASGPLDRYRLPKRPAYNPEANVGRNYQSEADPTVPDLAYFLDRARERRARGATLSDLDRDLLRKEGEL